MNIEKSKLAFTDVKLVDFRLQVWPTAHYEATFALTKPGGKFAECVGSLKLDRMAQLSPAAKATLEQLATQLEDCMLHRLEGGDTELQEDDDG